MKDPTRAPIFACLYPGLCDVARRHGYALAIHGTVTTDLDLIAVPWIDGAADPVELKRALLAHIGACGYADLLRRDCPHLSEENIRQLVERDGGRGPDDAELKPHGRLAWNLYLEAGTKVDLSVFPRVAGGEPKESEQARRTNELLIKRGVILAGGIAVGAEPRKRTFNDRAENHLDEIYKTAAADTVLKRIALLDEQLGGPSNFYGPGGMAITDDQKLGCLEIEYLMLCGLLTPEEYRLA